MPFLKVRNPTPASYEAVVAFSKKTGDHAVLSRQDLGILALAYEVHCDRNGGPWGLREAPKQPVKMKSSEEVTADQNIGANESAAPVESANLGQEAKMTEEAQPSEGAKPDLIDEQAASPEKKRKRRKAKKGGANVLEQSAQNEVDQHGEPTTTEQDGQPSESQPTLTPPGEQAPPQDTVRTEPESTDLQAVAATSAQEQLPATQEPSKSHAEIAETDSVQPVLQGTESTAPADGQDLSQSSPQQSQTGTEKSSHDLQEPHIPTEQSNTDFTSDQTHLSEDFSTLNLSTPPSPPATDDSDSDGDWITPSNLSSRQAKDSGLQNDTQASAQTQMDIATMTIDFAMQSVLLQMNLNLLSTNMQRIKHLRSKVLRCHACFHIERNLTKQFCPRCGGTTLKRVSCSTNAKGEFHLHLAKNYQFNKRGDRYSVPKPIAGTANGKWSGHGGGQGGWGRDLILTEDQKEYQRQVESERRSKGARDLMDDDYLPGILTGDRGGRAGGRVKVGAGKNVNSKKRF
tara:strand:- start:25434 stop:26978 length:1545 start_codon:yes stop_codon:yes gene_type:complete